MSQMWISIGKLEFKKGFVYYFLLYLFFFFWSIFTLFGLFVYKNLTLFNKNYFQKVGVSILFYPKENISIEDLKKIFLKFNYLSNFEIYPPQKVYIEIEKDLPTDFIKNEEIDKIFPYLIKIKLKSISELSKLKKDVELIQEISKNKFEILPEPGIKNLPFIKYLHYGLIIFLSLWNLFYLIFFIFLNQGLNNHLKNQIEIFQLLGGHILKFKLIRALIIIIPLHLLLMLSSLLYYFFTKNLIYLFPFLNFFPNLNNIFEIIFFVLYFSFLILIYPLFIVFFSFKKI